MTIFRIQILKYFLINNHNKIRNNWPDKKVMHRLAQYSKGLVLIEGNKRKNISEHLRI